MHTFTPNKSKLERLRDGDADLVFEENLVGREEDVEFHSLAVNMNPFVGPDLSTRQNGGEQACLHTLTAMLQMKRHEDKPTMFLLLMSPR